MPIQRTKRVRLLQIERWLRANFRTPYPVSVHVLDELPKGVLGLCHQRRRRIYIGIAKKKSLELQVESLFHEWAHAMSHRHANMERQRDHRPHDEEWGLALAKIYSKYHDEGGYEASGDF